MAGFQFDLVSPEQLLFSGAVEQVDVPGAEGDFGVLAQHAPMVSMLRPGILTVHRPGGALRVVVGGGFAEVSAQGLTVLAELAVPVEEFDRTQLAQQIKDAEEDVADARDEATRDKLRLKLEQLHALQSVLSGAATAH
ncbi:MAG: F0F1 ATP synthase subunit epsilon [Xanthobacteraceae bacterium]|nr:F0F1 ATP synthase subunit epsilon [Xanthobacteraceae bacterium]